MAILHVKTPNGTTKTVDLETMNITSSLKQNGWCKLPNGLIIQWISNGAKIVRKIVEAVIRCAEMVLDDRTCQKNMQILRHETRFLDMNVGFWCNFYSITVTESGVRL